MTSRQQRRTLERKARKQAVRGESARSQTPAGPLKLAGLSQLPVLHRTEPATLVDLPKSDYRELIPSLNLAILLPNEEPTAYRTHLLHFFRQHTPAGGIESDIVKRLADLQWRLQRIANLEAGIFALGRLKNAELFNDADPAVRIALLDANTLVSEGLPLKRLHTQENRLRRFYRNDCAELTAIQANRLNSQPAADADESSETVVTCTDPDGFEFTNSFELDLAAEEDSAECLSFMLGSEFSTDVVCAGASQE